MTLSVSVLAQEENGGSSRGSSSGSGTSSSNSSGRRRRSRGTSGGEEAPPPPPPVITAEVEATVETPSVQESSQDNHPNCGATKPTSLPVVPIPCIIVPDEDNDELKVVPETPEEAAAPPPAKPSEVHQNDVLGVYTNHLQASTPVVGESRRKLNSMVEAGASAMESLEMVDCVEAPTQQRHESEL